MKKFISLLICASLLSFFVPAAFCLAEDDDLASYVSTDDFSTSAGNGKWGEVWSAQLFSNSQGAYTNMTCTCNGDKEWCNGWNGNWTAFTVSGDKLQATKDVNSADWASRTFTAPVAGTVTLTSEQCQATSATSFKFRIVLESKSGEKRTLFPADATEDKSYAEYSGWGIVDAICIDGVEVSAGDKIHYELSRSGSNASAAVLPFVSTVTYTEYTQEGDTVVYDPAENYTNTSGDGTWGEVWSAQLCSAAGNEYSNMRFTHGDAYCNGFNGNWKGFLVSASTMQTAATQSEDSAVRTFTAPMDGIVTLGKCEFQETGGGAAGVRITIARQNGNTETVWPKPSDSGVEDGYKVFAAWEWVTQPAIRNLAVARGDKIHFEGKKKSADAKSSKFAWSSTVTYTDYTEYVEPLPGDKRIFRASDSYSDEENGDNVWRWQFYDVSEAEYKDLTYHIGSNSGFGDYNEETGEYNAGTSWNEVNNAQGVSVGRKILRPTVQPGAATNEEKDGNARVRRDYAVRTFTAPSKGNVSIGTSEGWLEGLTANFGTHLRIMYHPASGGESIQIWPEEPGWLNVIGKYPFAPIEIDLNKDDRLTFENAFIYSAGGQSPWYSKAYWDPVVEYNTILPVMVSAEPADGAADLPLNLEHIFTFDNEIAEVAAKDIKVYIISGTGEIEECDAFCKTVITEGCNVGFILGGLKPYTGYLVKIQNVRYGNLSEETGAEQAISFTTGSIVNINSLTYSDGKVICEINNSADTAAAAAVLAAVCKGTESKYTIETMYYSVRNDIGEDDRIEVSVNVPDGSDYFIKAIVLEDMEKARAYTPVKVLRGGT